MSIQTYVLTILETRDARNYGFALTRCDDGKQIKAQSNGGENNIRLGVTYTGKEFRTDVYQTANARITERELFKLPHAGCMADEIRAYIVKEFGALDMAEAEETRRGEMLIEVLGIKADPDHVGRYLTTHGNKTPLGIFRTVERIVKEGK